MRIAHTLQLIGISGGVEWGGHDGEEEERERGEGIELAMGGLNPIAITEDSYSSNAIDRFSRRCRHRRLSGSAGNVRSIIICASFH